METDYFDMVAGVLQGDTLAPYLFIICLDYMLRTSVDKIKENGFKLTKERSRSDPTKTITYTTTLLANAPTQAETLLHSLKQATAGIGLHVNAYKTEYMCFNQTGDISTLNGSFLKLIDKFINWDRHQLAKAWTDINRLLVILKLALTDKMKRSFFQAAVMLILLYGCTKRMEKKLDGNYTRTLWAILNKYWRQHSTKQQLYGHLPPIIKTIKFRWIRHAAHIWRSRDELISDILLWTPSHGRAKARRPARTYIQQFCADTRCSLEDLLQAMDDSEGWRERARDIRADGMTWWWWYIPKSNYWYSIEILETI